MITIRVLSAVLLLFAAGCADSIVSECDDEAKVRVDPRLSDIQEKVFDVSCATPGCHAGSNPQAGLDLTAANAYDQLVGVESVSYPGRSRVVAGNSSESILIELMRGSLSPAMPPQGPLDAEIINAIAVWIDNGARRELR
ncbi:MAG: hypothetical protein C0600_14915 [Ignavibacteria bacterium]|nr:MAG: hypothetical protein C0600_14915 [Ignavibacteria bacterium]